LPTGLAPRLRSGPRRLYHTAMRAAHALWAPWRMAYIRGPKPTGCIFCEYPSDGPAHFRERLILCERPHGFVILNRYPFAAGHLMVVPRRHTSDLVGLDTAEHSALFDFVRDASTALRSASNADGLNIGINLGASAGAGMAEHLHVHVVPRWPGDQNFMPVVADARVIPEALEETYARLLPYFVPLGVAVPPSVDPRGAESPSSGVRRARPVRRKVGRR